MKRKTCIAILLLTMIATACGSTPTSNRSNRNFGTQSGASTGELPAATRLLVGTLKLDGTDQAVTGKQASDLLPLWQTMKVLSTSDTAAQQEKDALTEQIQETMTAGQRQAITNMKLTRADMFTFLQGQGTAAGAGNSFASGQNNNSQNRSSSSNGTNRRNFGQGGGGFFPGAGGPPDGGFGGGQGQNASAIATAQASRQQQRNGTFIPTALLNAVIEYLQKKAGA